MPRRITPVRVIAGDLNGDHKTLRNTDVKPQILIGTKFADVPFSGLSPQFVGVNQLNVVVPTVGAGVVPLQINAAGVISTDQVTIAVQ